MSLFLKTISIRKRDGRAENSTMGSSHLNALQVAYQAAGRTVEIRHKEIYVGG